MTTAVPGGAPVAGSPATAPRRPRLLARVHDVRPISPAMRRVRLAGADLGRFHWPGPASHLKLVLPLDDTPWPLHSDPDQETGAYLDPRLVVTRTYTPRAWDPVAGLLSVDIFLHGDGVAARWAAGAVAGDRVAVSVPTQRFVADPTADWLVIAGDESAAPALASILDDDVLDRPIHAFVETSDAGSGASVGLDDRVTAVTRADRAPGIALGAALAAALPAGSGQVWLAAEAGAVRRLRRWLLVERGLPRSRVVTRGYWRIGETNHPDHDFGESPVAEAGAPSATGEPLP